MLARSAGATLALLAALAAGCGGGPSRSSPSLAHPSAETSAETSAEGLYSAAARDYGFDFDGHVREVDRLPHSSLVRRCLHPDLISRRSFFAIGCQAELTRLRGFSYSWQMRSDAVPCRLHPDQEDREVLLAFTHEPSALELPREMLRAWIGPGVAQTASEAASSLERARRMLGHWPSRQP